MNVGDRFNVWIVGEGPVKYRAQVIEMKDSKHGRIPVSIRLVAPDGRLTETVFVGGQFVYIYDQSTPANEVH